MDADIVTRLRDAIEKASVYDAWGLGPDDILAAADEIERLRRLVDHYRDRNPNWRD